jgi:acetolactate synthase I/II/III large subunit
MITHILDSLEQKTKIQIVSMHHEQAAAFAADAMGRLTGVPGVALATSGPGATNLLTGIGSCYFDSVPAVFITGQVNTHELRGDRAIRQQGFQETDIVPMARPITKAAILVKEASELPAALTHAFELAMSGRPGPVLLDIPMNVQRGLISGPAPSLAERKVEPVADLKKDYQSIYEALSSAKKPLILAGRGIRASGSHELFMNFLKLAEVPVCLSLLGLDNLSFAHPLRVGFFGAYGNRWSNQAIAESDLLLVLGARLDIRQTGADTKFFSSRKIIHVDVESAEINNRVQGSHAVVSDLREFLKGFNEFLSSKKKLVYGDWLKMIRSHQEKMSDVEELKNIEGINPNRLMHEISRVNTSAAYSVDVGAHQMWAAQSLEIKADEQFMTSGGMGAMGFSLPAAIGAVIATGKPCTVIVGDGCMQLNIQELQTIVRKKLPVRIIVLNNKSLGMIRQFQDSYFDSRHQSTVWGYSAPAFDKVAEAYGVPARVVNNESETKDALNWLFASAEGPRLVHIHLSPKTNVYPKIAFGRPLHQMEPSFKPEEMEST